MSNIIYKITRLNIFQPGFMSLIAFAFIAKIKYIDMCDYCGIISLINISKGGE
jgi:hypothetical protein